jgi:hypothetical protein
VKIYLVAAVLKRIYGKVLQTAWACHDVNLLIIGTLDASVGYENFKVRNGTKKLSLHLS